MSHKNRWKFQDDFMGHRVYSATAGSNVGHNWLIKKTAAAGTPTFASLTPSNSGEFQAQFDNTAEVQVVTLFQNDVLQFALADILQVTWRLKMSQAVINANTILTFGLASAQNNTADSIAESAWFRLDGGVSTANVLVETDDSVNDNNAIATGKALSTTYRDFTISFAKGIADVRFFVDGVPVATAQVFDMSNYTGSLQLFLQMQKAANAETDGVIVDYVEIEGRRHGVA